MDLSSNRTRTRDDVNNADRSASGGDVLARKHKKRKKRKRSVSHSSSLDESRQMTLRDTDDNTNPSSYAEHLGQLHRLDVQVRRRLTLGVKFLEGEYPNITVSSLYDAPISQLLDDMALAMEHLFEVVPWRCRIMLFRKFPRDQELFLVPQLPATMVGDYFQTNDLIHCRVRQTAEKCPSDCPCKGGGEQAMEAIEDEDDDRSMMYDDGERVDDASASASSAGRATASYLPRSAFLPNGSRHDSNDDGYESVDHFAHDNTNNNNRRRSGGNARVRQRSTEVPKSNEHGNSDVGEEEATGNPRVIQLSPRDVAKAHKHKQGRVLGVEAEAATASTSALSQDVIHDNEYGLTATQLAATQPFDANDSESNDDDMINESQHDVRAQLNFGHPDDNSIVQNDIDTTHVPTALDNRERPTTPCYPADIAAAPATPSGDESASDSHANLEAAAHTPKAKPEDTHMNTDTDTVALAAKRSETVRSPALVPVEIGRSPATPLGSPIPALALLPPAVIPVVIAPISTMPLQAAENEQVINTDADDNDDESEVDIDNDVHVGSDDKIDIAKGDSAPSQINKINEAMMDEVQVDLDANTSQGSTTPAAAALVSDEASVNDNDAIKAEATSLQDDDVMANIDGSETMSAKSVPGTVGDENEDNAVIKKSAHANVASDNDSDISSDDDDDDDDLVKDDDGDKDDTSIKESSTPVALASKGVHATDKVLAAKDDASSAEDNDSISANDNDDDAAAEDKATSSVKDKTTLNKDEDGKQQSVITLVIAMLGSCLDDAHADLEKMCENLENVLDATKKDEKHTLCGRMEALQYEVMSGGYGSAEELRFELQSIVNIANEEHVASDDGDIKVDKKKKKTGSGAMVLEDEDAEEEEDNEDTSQVEKNKGSIVGVRPTKVSVEHHIDSSSGSDSDSDNAGNSKTKVKPATATVPRRRRTTLGGEQTTLILSTASSSSKSKSKSKSKLANMLPLPSPTPAPQTARRKSGLMGRRKLEAQKTGTAAGLAGRGALTVRKPVRPVGASPGEKLSFPNTFKQKSKSAKPKTRTKSQFPDTPVAAGISTAVKRKKSKATTGKKRLKKSKGE